jgi:hypothetical protein
MKWKRKQKHRSKQGRWNEKIIEEEEIEVEKDS